MPGEGRFADPALVVDVRLIRADRNLAATLREGSEDLQRRYGVEKTLTAFPSVSRRDNPWGGYVSVDEAKDLVIAFCAFKGPPGADGIVEIAYYTFAEYEGRGYAKGASRALVSIARSSPLVREVVAHTLPETNASISVLRSVGMRFVGEVVDPEDGPVWRWRFEPND